MQHLDLPRLKKVFFVYVKLRWTWLPQTFLVILSEAYQWWAGWLERLGLLLLCKILKFPRGTLGDRMGTWERWQSSIFTEKTHTLTKYPIIKPKLSHNNLFCGHWFRSDNIHNANITIQPIDVILSCYTTHSSSHCIFPFPAPISPLKESFMLFLSSSLSGFLGKGLSSAAEFCCSPAPGSLPPWAR